jgi:DNA-binding XRE family transcriptional regulator
MGAKKGNNYAKGNKRTSYITEFDKQAYNYCLLGATDEDLAKFFEVAESTINNWKKSNPSFLESIKRGKEFADVEVVKSLFKRAVGYNYKEVTSIKIDKGNGKVDDVDEEILDEDYIPDAGNGFTKLKVVTKEIVPDTTAQIFWLKNRQPKRWRDKQEVDHTSSGEKVQITYFELPNDGRNT